MIFVVNYLKQNIINDPLKKMLLALPMSYDHYRISTVYRNILELIHYLSLMCMES